MIDYVLNDIMTWIFNLWWLRTCDWLYGNLFCFLALVMEKNTGGKKFLPMNNIAMVHKID